MTRVTTQHLNSQGHTVEPASDHPVSASPSLLPPALRGVLAFLFGALGAVIYLLIAGYLTIQAHGLRWGVVVDLNNSVVSLNTNQTPLVPMIALGVVTSAVVFLLLPRHTPTKGATPHVRRTNAHSYTFMFVITTVVIVAMTLTERPYFGGVLGMDGLRPERLPAVAPEILVPFTWIQTSALEATTVCLLAVLLTLHVHSLVRRWGNRN